MQLRGNYILFFSGEILIGIILFIACLLYGDLGLLTILLFFLLLALTQKTKVDEREIYLLYKSGSIEGAAMGAAMGLLYTVFKDLNWFHSLLAFAMVARGVTGLYLFTIE